MIFAKPMSPNRYLKLVVAFVVSAMFAETINAQTIRSQAVVDLTFDDPAAVAVDRAQAGKSKDNGQLMGRARRVPSPFWNQRGKRAVIFNALRKQYIQIPDGSDTDRPSGVTLSFFFLNLHPTNDAAARGIVAKRIDGAGKASANYGINYVGRGDTIQPYINDGQFRVPQYSLNLAAGTRRLTYLTATFEVADAPGSDKDTKKDDVRIRLYANGKLLKPKNGVNAVVMGNDAWAIDVNLKRLVNNTPLVLGATNAKIEHCSCLIDEFTLFNRALSPKEVGKLFLEVAGKDAAKLATDELKPPSNPAPKITAVSMNGLQIGSKTRLVITGQNLGRNPQVHLPIKGVKQQVAKGSNAGRVVLDMTLPNTVRSGYYPLRVQTDDGLSTAKIVAVDNLPQIVSGTSTREKPTKLPAAFSGTIAGAQRQQVYFQGKAGQQVIADVEAKRLGSAFDPVVEIKTAAGTPLAIAWGRVNLKGDARAVAKLPADGLYYVELHDLAFKAPGQNAFRLKVGALKLVDAWFPPAVAAGGMAKVLPVGAGIGKSDVVSVAAKKQAAYAIPDSSGLDGPLPPVRVSEGREFVEPANSAGVPNIDARFKPNGPSAVFVNGRLTKPSEADRYLLTVQPGQRLDLRLLGRAISSPIDAEVTVRAWPKKTVLSSRQDSPGTRDPAFAVTVPKDAKQIEVIVRDIHRRGGSNYVYRMRVAPAGRPNFSLAVVASQLNIPAGGSGFLQLQVTRAGYNGPIQLSLDGRKDVEVLPKTIPAGRSGWVFATVNHKGTKSDDDFAGVQLVGEGSVGKTKLRRTATMSGAVASIPGWEAGLPLIVGRAAPYSIRVSKPPVALFKGSFDATLLELKRPDSLSGNAVRLSVISSERPRRKNPRRPRQGNKPLVRALPGQAIPAGAKRGRLTLAVPLDVAERSIEFVIKAELVPHAYSNRVLATSYSQPFRVPVKPAVTVTVDPKSLNLKAGGRNFVRGTVKRTPGFKRPVVIRINGLPKGYTAKPVTVPPDKSTFAIPVTAAAVKKLRVLQKITLTAVFGLNRSLIAPRPLALKVAPVKKK